MFGSEKKQPASEAHWIPLADLMTGLMMMFMLIAVLYMLKINSAAESYSKTKNELGTALCTEFSKDLKQWDAECDPTGLVIRFKAPDVLFDTGQSILKPKFTNILDDFFPRYINILESKQFKDSIEEIRIEGHTSSKWSVDASENQAYFLNMELSQARTRSVLQHVLMVGNLPDKNWLRLHLTANGLSSSHLIYKGDGKEDSVASQRVEFRIRTNADQRINEILNVFKP